MWRRLQSLAFQATCFHLGHAYAPQTGLDSPCDTAYLLELDTWAEIKYRRTAALRGYICSLSKLKRAGLQLSSHPSRRLYVGANKDNATSDPHFGHSSFSDAEQYARYREPPAIDLDRGNVHIGGRYEPMVLPYRTVTTMRPIPAVHILDCTVRVNVVGVG
ncbi:hypothetical protein MRX96_032718 [Rhipicephalus microplus]